MLCPVVKCVLPRICATVRPTFKNHATILGASTIRSLSSLAVLEQRNGKLEHSSLSAVTAAQRIGGPVIGFVAGSEIKAVAEEASRVKGLDKVIMVENGAYDKVWWDWAHRRSQPRIRY